MKKIISLVLVSIFLLTIFASCGKESSPVVTPTTGKEETTSTVQESVTPTPSFYYPSGSDFVRTALNSCKNIIDTVGISGRARFGDLRSISGGTLSLKYSEAPEDSSAPLTVYNIEAILGADSSKFSIGVSAADQKSEDSEEVAIDLYVKSSVKDILGALSDSQTPILLQTDLLPDTLINLREYLNPGMLSAISTSDFGSVFSLFSEDALNLNSINELKVLIEKILNNIPNNKVLKTDGGFIHRENLENETVSRYILTLDGDTAYAIIETIRMFALSTSSEQMKTLCQKIMESNPSSFIANCRENPINFVLNVSKNGIELAGKNDKADDYNSLLAIDCAEKDHSLVIDVLFYGFTDANDKQYNKIELVLSNRSFQLTGEISNGTYLPVKISLSGTFELPEQIEFPVFDSSNDRHIVLNQETMSSLIPTLLENLSKKKLIYRSIFGVDPLEKQSDTTPSE